MRSLLVLLLCASCGELSRPSVVAEPGPCDEVWRPLEPDEVSPWGTSVSQVRVLLGGEHPVDLNTQATSGLGGVQLAWPGGLERLIFAEPVQPPDPAPPGWCEDGIELPATLQLTLDGGAEVRALGRLRALGSPPQLVAAFVGSLPLDTPALLDALDGAAPDGASGWAVWATWARTDAGWSLSGQIRPQSDSGDEVGAVALSFDGH